VIGRYDEWVIYRFDGLVIFRFGFVRLGGQLKIAPDHRPGIDMTAVNYKFHQGRPKYGDVISFKN
jgi:hypothetical protein